MSIDPEFATVDLIINSTSDRRGVDAFALSILKAERQIRRIFTHIVYQAPAFNSTHIDQLIDCLATNKNVYFEGFVSGIDNLYQVPLSDIYGDKYEADYKKLDDIRCKRNKIFHGQLTGSALGTEALLAMVEELRSWCIQMAGGALDVIGYDGIGDSFQKSLRPDAFKNLKVSLRNTDDYRCFIKRHVQR